MNALRWLLILAVFAAVRRRCPLITIHKNSLSGLNLMAELPSTTFLKLNNKPTQINFNLLKLQWCNSPCHKDRLTASHVVVMCFLSAGKQKGQKQEHKNQTYVLFAHPQMSGLFQKKCFFLCFFYFDVCAARFTDSTFYFYVSEYDKHCSGDEGKKKGGVKTHHYISSCLSWRRLITVSAATAHICWHSPPILRDWHTQTLKPYIKAEQCEQ